MGQYGKYDKYDDDAKYGDDQYDDNDLSTGTVTSFRGSFGWIECDDGSGDAYVHFQDIKGGGYRKLFPGQRVEFILIKQKGDRMKAVEVTAPNRKWINNNNNRGRGRG